MTKKELLKRFMKEHFPYGEFRKAGIFTKEMRGDYEAQAEHIRTMLGYESVFEYGSREIRCHLTFSEERPLHVTNTGELYCEPFVTVINSIYE